MSREGTIKAILKKIIDIKFNLGRDDRPVIDDESIYEFLNLLGADTIADIKAELDFLYNDTSLGDEK